MISLRKIYQKFFRKRVCADCKTKLDKQFGLKHRIKHRVKRRASKIKHRSRKVIGRIKTIRIRKRGGGFRSQKVKVLASGKYRFIKN